VLVRAVAGVAVRVLAGGLDDGFRIPHCRLPY
jgi:hypothetical protein